MEGQPVFMVMGAVGQVDDQVQTIFFCTRPGQAREGNNLATKPPDSASSVSLNNLEKTDPSEIERTYNIRKQHTGLY